MVRELRKVDAEGRIGDALLRSDSITSPGTMKAP